MTMAKKKEMVVMPILLAEAAEAGSGGPIRAWCPYCAKYHYHGTGDGHRVAHCMEGPFKDRGYYLLTPSTDSDKTKNSARRMRRAASKMERVTWHETPDPELV
jgi:hypothetical protein